MEQAMPSELRSFRFRELWIYSLAFGLVALKDPLLRTPEPKALNPLRPPTPKPCCVRGSLPRGQAAAFSRG